MSYRDFKLALLMSDEYSHHCVNIMIAKGADINAVDPTRGHETPLMKAVQRNKELCVKVFLQSGVNVHQIDIYGKDALMHAAHGGHFNCMKELIQTGAHVNALSCAGLNALGYFRLHHCWDIGKKMDGTWVHTFESSTHVGDEPPFSQDQEAALRLLLQKGSKINGSRTFLCGHHQTLLPTKFYAVLRAAGEDMKMFSIACDQEEENNNILDPKKLKELCRATIRQCMLKVDRHTDLFRRIPKMGLPTTLAKYLLYNEELGLDQTEKAVAVKRKFETI